MKTHRRRSLASLLAPVILAPALLAVGACQPADTAGDASAAPSADISLQAATALGVRNAAMPVPGVVTAGQLTPEQLDGLVAAGFGSFISLRGPDEDGAGWEEAHTRGAPVSFQRLQIDGGAGLTREAAEELARLLEQAGEGTVLYCGSSNRVGALMALKGAYVDGLEPEAALELGRAAGMTRLEPRVMEILGLSGS